MVTPQVRDAVRTLGPLLRRRGTSVEVGQALRRAIHHLDTLLVDTDRGDAVSTAIQELESCLQFIGGSDRPADHKQVDGATMALGFLRELVAESARPKTLLSGAGCEAIALAAPIRAEPSVELLPSALALVPPPSRTSDAPTRVEESVHLVVAPIEAVPPPVRWASEPDLPFTADIIAEHLDEAGFRWGQWEAAKAAPNYTATEVEEGPEERLRSHLDALVLGGRMVADAVLVPALVHGESEVRFAAAWCLATRDDDTFVSDIIAPFRSAVGQARWPLFRALTLGASSAVREALTRSVPDLPPAVRREAVEIIVRRDRGHADIAGWLASGDAALVAGALYGARGDSLPDATEITFHLGSSDASVRRGATRAGLLAGVPAAWQACVERASSSEADDADFVTVATLGGTSEHATVERASADDARRKAALFALGFVGSRHAAEVCLAAMAEAATAPTAARVAADSFAAITGCTIDCRFARPEPPDDNQDSATLDGGDATAAEGVLPLPDHVEIQKWWAVARSRFVPGVRHLGGVPITGAGLVRALANGPMRRRAGLAFELAARTKGACFVDVGDWVKAQRIALAAAPLPRNIAFDPLARDKRRR